MAPKFNFFPRTNQEAAIRYGKRKAPGAPGALLTPRPLVVVDDELMEEIMVYTRRCATGQWLLTVIMCSGDSIKIEVNASTTIDDIKAKIQEVQGIRPTQQRLIFAGKVQDIGSDTMSDLEEPDGCFLDLRGHHRLEVEFQDRLGESTFVLLLPPGTGIANVKKNISDLTDIPMENLYLYEAACRQRPLTEEMLRKSYRCNCCAAGLGAV
jgi:ubiquitin